MAEVTLEKVVKVYPGNVEAVKGIDLQVKNEEFVVLVGPSGCGKSTTLRMIAGLEEITAGTIRIGDRIINDVPPKSRDIAMVFQNYALYPHMTVYKNMAFGLKLRKVPKAEIHKRVIEAAEILGMVDLLERKPKALSGGQRQRVAVGRAIVRNPASFLFDEPLSNLDAKLRVETRAELKRLHKRLKTTTIYVTHDQEEAMTLGDRVVVMDNGLIQACDTPLNVYNGPANRFVAGFLGTPPMNFVDGKLIQDHGSVYFQNEIVNVRLEKHQAECVADKIGQPVVFGIRPEGMYLHQSDEFNNEDQTIPLKIVVVEPLGNTMDIYCTTSQDQQLVARVRAESIQESTQVNMYLDMQKTHIFDLGDHGLNLTLSSPTSTDVATADL